MMLHFDVFQQSNIDVGYGSCVLFYERGNRGNVYIHLKMYVSNNI